MASEKRLSRTVGTKVTPEEESEVKDTAARLNLDVSAFVRRAVLHELSDGPLDAAEAMLELFVRTMEASLELGDGFTVEQFRKLCGEVKARCSGKPATDALKRGDE
ncbi:MAG: hypothetical protein WB992_05700 [Bryobacteraceae bacterium]